MSKKSDNDDVKVRTYRKGARCLRDDMMKALGHGKGLSPILDEVKRDGTLRLDIRDGRFNVYYRGGSLLCVDGRKKDWTMSFAKEYFANRSDRLPKLPARFASTASSLEWVAAFPPLKKGMDDWWEEPRHSRKERDHCQQMALGNSPREPSAGSDYLVLDMEYQWFRRRLDLIAARRNPTPTDPSGWAEPVLVFVEVKSDLGACKGDSGLAAHVKDYSFILKAEAKDGRATEMIKKELQDVMRQKRELGLFAESAGFSGFSGAKPELLVVFIHMPTKDRRWPAVLDEVGEVTRGKGIEDTVRFMRLTPSDYVMTRAKELTLDQMRAQTGC